MIRTSPCSLELDGARVPQLIYGTAWKEDATRRLTEMAIEKGFRGIDTANQRKHYFESAVGQAVESVLARGLVTRDELFLQSKFTFRHGQDHRLPYDPQLPIAKQVEQSFANSLSNLCVGSIDSFILHGPAHHVGLASDDWDAWRAMEDLKEAGQVRFLGISNVSLEQLQLLCRGARIRPQFVQNRCFAVSGWDKRVRQFCSKNGIVYQGFSLLTANREWVMHPIVANLARKYKCTLPQMIFRFATGLKMTVLTGTNDPEHMRHDLEAMNCPLTADEITSIENIATKSPAC